MGRNFGLKYAIVIVIVKERSWLFVLTMVHPQGKNLGRFHHQSLPCRRKCVHMQLFVVDCCSRIREHLGFFLNPTEVGRTSKHILTRIHN